jgi:membrane-associated phospholipid phosphatase
VIPHQIRTFGVALLAAATLNAPSVAAQTSAARDSARDNRPLFTWRDGVLAAGFAGLTVAMFPVDQSVAQRLQNPSNQTNRFFHDATKDLQAIADPGAIIIGLSLYGIGRAGGWRPVADLGAHGLEALVVSGVVTGVIKGVAGRARPNISGDTSARDFQLWRGFGNGGYKSFPSGHTTAAFAAASVVTSEIQHSWPRAAWIVGPAMYGGAALVGLSRMYNNAHWASDVVLGAAIGTFSGIKIVRYNHTSAGNAVDRWLFGAEVGPSGDGRVSLRRVF